eukprot:TRINITY_DN858_c0_g1_i1.p1 TRINITY_DN858_c0_g1~~TRINITY_DN858_c0_g1_i1.p1  ORF type:complete len:146 (-),score=24.23 TRINITY_DN858_c0_g1_i1:53-490(-)
MIFDLELDQELEAKKNSPKSKQKNKTKNVANEKRESNKKAGSRVRVPTCSERESFSVPSPPIEIPKRFGEETQMWKEDETERSFWVEGDQGELFRPHELMSRSVLTEFKIEERMKYSVSNQALFGHSKSLKMTNSEIRFHRIPLF